MTPRPSRLKTHLFANKFVDGRPPACIVSDISEGDAFITTSLEPLHSPSTSIGLELVFEEQKARFWLPSVVVRSQVGGVPCDSRLPIADPARPSED